MKKNTKNLILNILIPVLLSVLVFLFTRKDISYLNTLHQTLLVPPIVFPLVWTTLYILMGIWMHSYQKEYPEDKKTKTIYVMSLLVNYLFSFLLFSWHQIVISLIDVLILLILVGYLFVHTYKRNKKTSFFLIPYVTWLCFALYLMIDLCVYNL